MVDDTPGDVEPSIDQLWSYARAFVLICIGLAVHGRNAQTATAVSLCGGLLLTAIESARRKDLAASAKGGGRPDEGAGESLPDSTAHQT